MPSSPGNNEQSANRVVRAWNQPSCFRSLHCIVQLCSLAIIVCACVAGTVSTAVAQEERPQIPLGERRPTQKKDIGPRALALLRLSENGKASIEPIAILINGKFWDASAYKADPVPMALEPGTVYEAERSGASLGLFTINSALQSNGVRNQPPWIATGAWHPTGTESAQPATVAVSTPVGIGTDDAPPRLTHDVSKNTPPATTTPAAGSAPASAPPSKPAGSSSSDEPPRLSKPASSSSKDSSADSAKGNTSAAPQDKSKASIKEDKPSVPASDSGTDEAGRPRLRRGRPAESFADIDEIVPGYAKPGALSSSKPANGGKVVEAAAAQGDAKLIPAISDAHGPNPHSYVYEWLKGEDGDRRKQMMDLAKQQLQAYLAAQAKARIAPKTAHASAAKTSSTPKTKEPIFENVQMIAYDLWNSNQPIIVLSATAHMPASSTPSAGASDLQYSILLVAYPDIYNNLHKLYTGVTDKYHLDITPKLDLIDAVDADGDGTGELLFRETSDAGSGWVVYRPTADKLYKMFDSLNPD